MSEKKRTFIAVDFSEEVKGAIADLVEALQKSLGAGALIKWVETGNIHLTLQFLGDVDAGLFPKLCGGLAGAFTDVEPFAVSIAGLGAFPSLVRPRVLWAGFQAGADSLKALATCAQRVTAPLGFAPEEKVFSPHVTLGRVRELPRSFPLGEKIQPLLHSSAGSCRITQVHLMASELKPKGPVYTTLDSFSLGR